MRNRYISFFITLVILCLTLGVGVSAAQETITISDSLKEAYYGGATYERFNGQSLIFSNGFDESPRVELSDEQAVDIDHTSARICGPVIVINYYFMLGGQATYYYCRTDSLETINGFLNGGGETYTFNISKLTGSLLSYDIVEVSADELFTNAVNLEGYKVNYLSRNDTVFCNNQDKNLKLASGWLLTDSDQRIYYLDTRQFGACSPENFNPEKYDSVVLWEITDAKWLKEALDNTQDPLDDVIDDEVDEFMNIFSIVILVMFLFVAPLIAMIICTVLAKKSCGIYRRLLTTVSVLLAIELLAFTAIIIIAIVM